MLEASEIETPPAFTTAEGPAADVKISNSTLSKFETPTRNSKTLCSGPSYD